MSVPIIGFAAYSGSGKTTLIEKLIPLLRAKGVRLAVIKHDGHRFDIDKEGKDSYRFSQAGAEMVILTSREKAAVIEQRELSLEESLRFVHDVDLVVVEGWKNSNIPLIGISRRATGKGLTAHPSRFLAIVTDEIIENPSVPIFGLGEIEALTDFIFKSVLNRSTVYGSFPDNNSQRMRSRHPDSGYPKKTGLPRRRIYYSKRRATG